MRSIDSMFIDELADFMVELGEKSYRAEQVFRHIHQQRVKSINEMTSLSKEFREKLKNYPRTYCKLVDVLVSDDGTRKYLLEFSGHAIIETVFMPYHDRNTLCISSQVGCKMGCSFCASTKKTFQRSLTAGEILQQVYFVEKDRQVRIDNIVLMGIGEPLDNYDEVLRFIRLVSHEKGKNLSIRSITLSTCGLVPRIRDLAEENFPINLAISLHATSDEIRRLSMPIAYKYSIQEILEACDYYFEKTGRRVSFEYVLVEGINDREEDIIWLTRNLNKPSYHINLIPLNPIKEYKESGADTTSLTYFQKRLEEKNLHVTIRNKRGADIDAACGQLRMQYGETRK